MKIDVNENVPRECLENWNLSTVKNIYFLLLKLTFVSPENVVGFKVLYFIRFSAVSFHLLCILLPEQCNSVFLQFPNFVLVHATHKTMCVILIQKLQHCSKQHLPARNCMLKSTCKENVLTSRVKKFLTSQQRLKNNVSLRSS